MPYMNQEGYQIYFDVTGKGMPVITTHGFVENGSYWGRTGISSALAQSGYQVIDMDMRGHGRSVPNGVNPDYSIETIAADIGALADFLRVGRFHLLTHATGGMAGSRYAMRHHERLLSFIATDTASMTLPSDKYCSIEWDDKQVPASPNLLKMVGDRISRELHAGGSFHQIVSDLRKEISGHTFGPFFQGFSRNLEPERCWRWTEEIYAVNNLEYCCDFAEGFGYGDPDPHVAELRKISCPTFLVVGDCDFSLVKPMEVMARNIPKAEYRVLDGLGHMTAIEDPVKTSQVILQFLKKY